MNKTKLSRIAAAVALTLGISGVAMAQTSSSMRGQIVGPAGQVVADTRIVIEHVPSGTRTTATTNDSGIFVASGLRVGGPYRVMIESDTYEGQTLEDIFLQLGDAYRLNAQLENRENVERIQVTGQRINFTSLQAGSSSTWGEDDIRRSPAFDRDLKDIVRQNPLATDLGDDARSLSVAGNNPRYNSITVDGIGQNDDFGLNSSGYPTNRSPISIDAIEQVSIKSVPFNARYSGFTGAVINAVTRSGENEFFGSVFYEYASDDLAGDPDPSRYDPNGYSPELNYKEETLGFSVGGPILQDRLFFFANYETYEEPTSIAQGPAGSSAVNQKDIDPSVISEIQRIAQDVYGVDAGDWNVQPDQKDEKMLLKLDWNINDDHRASFTYQRAEDEAANNTTTGGNTNLNLNSTWYIRNQLMDNYSLQVYSNWTNNFSTEFKASVKDVTTGQDPALGRNFGQVTVFFTDDENAAGDAGEIQIGPDRSRHANRLETTTTDFQLHGEYLFDAHNLQFGVEMQEIDVFNVFVQNSLGVFEFDSIADFEAQEAATIQYQNAYTNNSDDGAAEFSYGSTALYIQDSWDVNWDLTLNFGLRYERFNSDDRPAFNQNFMDRYGFANTNNMDGLDLLLPRFSFNYTLTDQITLRGGVGQFAGGRPNVWISNAYTNDGVTIVAADDLQNVSGADITEVPQSMQDSLVAGDGNTTPIDPNFEMPYETRYSLAIDYDDLDLGYLGEGWFAAAEFIYAEKNREVGWVNLAKVPLLDDNGDQVTTAGGRPLYVGWDPLEGPRPDEIGGYNTNRFDIMLTNVEGGDSLISTFTIGNAWDNGLSFRFSYTNQDVEDITSGGSSTAHSNYNYQTAVDKQNPSVGRASYEIEHRFLATLNYTTEFFSGYESKVSVFWDRSSGRPYSYALDTFRFRGFGDPSSNNLYSSTNYLPYIPTGADDPNVRYSGGLTYEEFATFLEAANLTQFAGGYAVRNEGNRGPWNTNLDVRFEQEVPGLFNDHKGSIYVDIRNVLAMLGDNQRHTVSYADTGVRIASVDIDPVTGQYIYGSPYGGFDATPESATFYSARGSTWTAKIGVRYRF
ncbi:MULTISPECIES: TonB-dependent receptor [Gammaproteobacteria]|uniref:TonB-dependent receptor n=1 Tax=Gammaproteobacteria TaxID=1236 RepID=UPI000DCFB786|nr:MULTISPECIES: TonB-dependent receptor [Gammaproteobacteria]RTE85952.1 TonB-dependent receptor [Aliidiomarina sp. B3213]TCZ90049.1 TonB-dependent receptor [Lysobacter sp. N42]